MNTLASRLIRDTMLAIEEMPADLGLADAQTHLGRALACVRSFELRHAKTDPSDLAPLSERREMPTMPPDGAE